jgi:hypothetical protein
MLCNLYALSLRLACAADLLAIEVDDVKVSRDGSAAVA